MKAIHLSPPYAKYLLGVAWALVIAFLFVLAVDSFITTPGGDSSIYTYVAKGMLQGEVPYLDRWDNKGPLFYVLNLIGLVIHTTWGIWVVQGFFLLGSAFIAFLLLRASFGILPALFALAVFLAYYRSFAPPGNFPELYGLLFQFLTLYFFMRSQGRADHARSRVHFAFFHLGMGALGAATFMLKPNLVVLWIVIGIYWLLMRGNSLRKLAWAIVGGGVPILFVATLFITIGAWGELWDAVIMYNLAHSNVSILERLHVIRDLAAGLFPASPLVIASWLVGIRCVALRQLRDEPAKGIVALSLILLPLEVPNASLSGFDFAHNFLPTLPVISLLMAFLVWLTLKQNLLAPTLLTAALLLGAAYFTLPFSNYVRLMEKYTIEGVVVEDRESIVAARVKEETEPGDKILVWGKGARIYLLADRDAPSRYFFHHPLTKPHYTTQSIRDEFVHDLESEMPTLIIDSRHMWFPPLDSAERADWQPRDRHMHDPADFDPFFDFVEANYVAVDTIWPFTIYALRLSDSKLQPPPKGELIVRSKYDVYLDGKTLTYVKSPCAHGDAANRFILHVIPVDTSALEGKSQETLDFSFMEGKDWHVGEACVVSRDLPNYPIASIRTGQYNASESAHDWLNEYHFPELQ